jgi:hypothetical protein
MAIRQSKSCIAVGLVTLLLGAGSAPALSSDTEAGIAAEQRCVATKLDAASHYDRCLIDALRQAVVQGGSPSDEQIARCDDRFDDAFARAERGGACHTPGGALRVLSAIKEQALSTFTNIVATQPCAALYIDSDHATCLLSTSASSIDLEAMLDQVNTALSVTQPNHPPVGDSTTLWIQAWSGQGGNGDDIGGLGNEGDGGNHGYAQTTTTVGDIDQAFGVTQLYYYLGRPGSAGLQTGGDGGTATFVSAVDATTTADVLAKTLLVAGGGGGGGAGNSSGGGNCKFETGFTGGGGAVAISPVGADSKVSGSDGQDRPTHDYSGQGGGSGGNGGAAGSGSSKPGDNQFAPVGGPGGNRATASAVGFLNQSGVMVTAGGGRGGAPGDGPAPGGGGGGGLAGGGGGGEATNDTGCNAGAGGGGSSLAIASTKSCSIAPTSQPANPNAISGFVQIGIDLGGC